MSEDFEEKVGGIERERVIERDKPFAGLLNEGENKYQSLDLKS
jgi:hypothetical protein